MRRPARSECHDYFWLYIDQVPEEDAAAVLERGLNETLVLLEELGEERAVRRYAPDKWSGKQVVGHLIDTERVFQGRALAFARAETSALPGFDQDLYARHGAHDTHALSQLMDELSVVRRSTLALFAGFTEELWSGGGVADGKPMSARAVAFVMAGHERHHRRVLRERY